MTTPISKKTLITSLLIFLISLTPQTLQDCNENCGYCLEQSGCQTCWNQFKTSEGGSCQEDQTVPEQNNCLAYTKEVQNKISLNICTLCKPGYYLHIDNPEKPDPKNLEKCRKVPENEKIKNCVGYFRDEIDKQFYCHRCNFGFPQNDKKSCERFAGEQISINCMWGSRIADKKLCYRCIEGFYIVSGLDGQCQGWNDDLVGCMIRSKDNDKFCNFCNRYSGWKRLFNTCYKENEDQENGEDLQQGYLRWFLSIIQD